MVLERDLDSSYGLTLHNLVAENVTLLEEYSCQLLLHSGGRNFNHLMVGPVGIPDSCQKI